MSQRAAPTLISLLMASLLSAACGMGPVVATWEQPDTRIMIRVVQRQERGIGFVLGSFYIFQHRTNAADNWRDVMVFRHDDPVEIPEDQVRVLNDRVAYAFMGWKYAVTTDGGTSWSVWQADQDLPNWDCCNYRLIRDVQLSPDGKGTMFLNPITGRRGEVPELSTVDFGAHWGTVRGG